MAMSVLERSVDELQEELETAREGNADLHSRLVILEARLRHRDSQVRWFRQSRDLWKLRCQLKGKRAG